MPEIPLPEAIDTVPGVVAWWAEQTPDAPAVLASDEGSSPVSYGELQCRVGDLAGHLAALGIGRGDVVAIEADRGADSVVAMLAAMRVGVSLPIAPSTMEADVAAFASLRPALLMAGAESPTARGARERQIAVFDASHDDHRVTEGTASAPAPPAAEDLALILHSSGATGRPRDIPRTHQNLRFAAAAYAAWMGDAAFSRVLVTTPLSFGMGAHALVATLCAGGAAVLADGVPGNILRSIAHWQPTWAYIVPALLEEILRETIRRGLPAASAWRAIGVAGMPPSRTLAERVAAVFGAPLVEGYGCGEAGLIAGSHAELEAAPGLMHQVYSHGIATVDDMGVPTGPGVPGEIVVWGPQVSAAYLGDASATAATFASDGTFRTGDIGVLDAAGSLRLTGRVKEIVNRGGEKLSLAEIDTALLAHPAVVEAAAFAMRDDRLGEEVAAAVVLRPGAAVTERELGRDVARRLTPAKVPRRIWFVAALPRTSTGKIRRGELSQMFGARTIRVPAGSSPEAEHVPRLGEDQPR